VVLFCSQTGPDKSVAGNPPLDMAHRDELDESIPPSLDTVNL
jgi:hypothetical protein